MELWNAGVVEYWLGFFGFTTKSAKCMKFRIFFGSKSIFEDCHFERSEKSFLDSSRSFGRKFYPLMTALQKSDEDSPPVTDGA
jgi:hypothetical protein